MKERRYDYAEGMFAAAAALERDKPEPFFARVTAMIAAQRYVEASYLVARVLAGHPDWARSVPDIKTAYVDPDQWQRTVADLKESIAKSPDSTAFQFVAGYVLYAAGQPAEARGFLTKAAELRGNQKGPEQLLLAAIQEQKAK